jgi:hypothetical protein
LIGLGSVGNSQEVIIGNQVWSKKNLNVSTFRNSDPIPEAKTECLMTLLPIRLYL